MNNGNKSKPTLHMIAGPNGAGKSTLYKHELAHRHPGLPFVNADVMMEEKLGRPAVTEEEAKEGQQLADARREQLIEAKQSFFTESVFSHPSKNVLLDSARDRGFNVFVYHVNVANPELAIKRVDARVREGGHGVDHDKVRQRYERSQTLIRDAVLKADRAFVYDNSAYGDHHRLALAFKSGNLQMASNVPSWARDLYQEKLEKLAPQRVNGPAHSFAHAHALTLGLLGADARTYVAQPGGDYRGPVLAKTDLHLIQQIGSSKTAIAHFKERVAVDAKVGDRVRITYDAAGKSANLQPDSVASRSTPESRAMAQTFRSSDPREAITQYPKLADSYAALRVFESVMREAGHPATKDQIDSAMEKMAALIEERRPLPQFSIRADRTRTRELPGLDDPDSGSER
ncbi:putative ABC-type ATPase [Stenotrophomonas sp. PvP093]|jgi:predicted ABC-type ATPase|uniref:KfrB domain-containing protein n=1 Tax=unclassified Stenotrophomonas TaxID=196198 RepID=UPI001AE5D1B6|nr:zeta toxin family protein [Stenotrophomonas sp. PvP093]MBP2480126.1 putative ABC-type ATPase [Stenotrophomonas sp. PvP093]